MAIGLLGDLVRMLNNSNAGYITLQLENATVIVADKKNAQAMIGAVEGKATGNDK